MFWATRIFDVAVEGADALKVMILFTALFRMP